MSWTALPLALVLALVAVMQSQAFPVGMNLSPLGGGFQGIQFTPVSTYAFSDLFKHCTSFVIRSTMDGIKNNIGYQSNSAVSWQSTGFPASLPYTNAKTFFFAMCDVGYGGRAIRAGVYNVSWTGTGDVGFGNDVNGVNATILARQNSSLLVRLSLPTTSSPDATPTGLNVRLLRSAAQDPVTQLSIIPVELADPVLAHKPKQVFHPEFLALFRGFDHVRFTQWSKLMNGGAQTKLWASRTLPTTVSQHGSDGVAIEHMVDLLRETNITSAWFSFPTASDDYNAKMLTLLRDTIPRRVSPTAKPFKLYIEAGSAESHGNTDRKAESLALFAAAQRVFQGLDAFFTIVPSTSIYYREYTPYVINWFGSSFSVLKAIAVPAQFGRGMDRGIHYDGYATWDLYWANYTVPEILKEIHHSSLQADFILNDMYQKLLAQKTSFEFVAWTGGPFFTAQPYAARYSKGILENCIAKNTYPCVWANTKMNVPNATEAQKLLPQLRANATMEQRVEDLLIAVQRSPELYDIYLDFLRRWEMLGGGLMMSNTLLRPAQRCLSGAASCGSDGIFEEPADITRCIAPRANNNNTIVSHPAVEQIAPCQKLWPLLDYKAGVRSALPYTANDLPQTAEPQCGAGCQWGTCDDGQCVCFAGYTGVDCSVLQTSFHRRNQCNNDTGLNVAGIADWSTEIPFVDLFLSSRAWISQDFPATAWSTGTKQYLRPDGYPANLTANQKLGTLMVRDLRGHYKAGVYTVLYDGDGVLSFSMDVQTVYRSVGRIEIYVQPSTGLNNGIFLMIERTNPADPIRNIRVIMPGYEDKYEKFPFNPFFLENLRPFKTLRFMEWMHTNVDVFSGEWSDRTVLNVNARGFVGNAGVSLEYMVLLANTLGTDAWFNIPHRATDDFVRRFAEYVKTHLRPDVKVYIEYSNEVWGTLFPGGQYCQSEGLKRGLSTNADTARFCFNMLRSSEIFNIWKDVYGASLAAERLEFVLNSQYVNPDVTKQLLACTSKLATHPVYSSVPLIHTAIAIAPYFGDYKPTRDTNLNLFLNTTLPAQIRGMASTIAGHNALTQANKLKLLTYESGTGFAGSGKDDDLVIQAVRSPEMSSLYVQYYEMLRANGVRLMLAFTSTEAYSTSRSWGQLESSDQNPLSAPKYQGLLRHIDAHSTCSAQTKQTIAAAERSARGFTCANDCSQSGLCVAQDTCECYYGSSGAMCDNAVYTEHRDLCGYYCGFWQGECVVDYIAGGTDRYWKCECHDNYYGPQCTLFDCEANCNYNGQCLDANVCHCFPGFTGAFCDIDCGCAGHGMCASNVTSGQPTCVCDVGFVWSEVEKKCVPDMRLSHTPSSVEVNNNNNNTSCSLSCEYGHCVRAALVVGGVRDTCHCWAGYNGTHCETPEAASETRTRSNAYSLIGANLGDITYYTTEPAFVDAMKMSSDWISVYASGYTQASDAYAFGNGQPIHLRSDGYPAYLEAGQNLVKMMLRDVHKHAVIAGRYVCLFDGEGVIDFNFDAKVTSIAKNRVEFDFFPTEKVGCTDTYCGDNGILLRLVRTNPLNPVRNIRVLMPGTEHTYTHEPFFRPFLDEIRRYNTLRFMDWMGTNHKREEMLDWSNRVTPAHASQAGSVSVEHMVDLCNRLGANPWFNIPHNATDNYVRQFARYVRRSLRPDVRVYLEYSNEVWNTLFPQGKHAQAEGLRLGLSTQPYEAGYRYFAQRSHEIFTIWKEEFATEIPLEMRKFNSASATAAPTLVRVLSTFTVSPSVTRTLLSWLQRLGGEADAVGVTGYFDCGTIGDTQAVTMTETDVHRMCIQGIPRTLAVFDEQRKAIQQANKSLPLVFYEAGQSLVEYKVIAYGNGDNPALTRLFLASNRHPGMTQVYTEYLNAYIANSLVSSALPFMQFTSVGVYSKYGSWGVFEFLGQPIESSPKYLALRQYFYYTDPQQMLLRFPQNFQNTVTGAANTNQNTTTTDSRYKYIHDFLTTIQANGVVPYEVDVSCAVCVSGANGVNGGTDCDKARIAWNADYLSVGFPHVTSPQRGDVWVAGNAVRHTLTWNVPADYPVTQPAQTVTVRLWKNAFCGLHGSLSHTHNGVLVWDYSAVPVSFASGRYELVLPESVSFDGSETYFLELRGMWYHSYLSEPFSVVRARTSPLVAVSLAPANCSSQSLRTQGCTVTQSPRFQSLASRVLSAHTVGGAEMNQWCMGEYTARTLSNTNTSMRTLPLSSCYTRVGACRLIRTHPKGKPIADCVANLSPFPALSGVRERVALTPQAALDYASYLRTIGWQTPLAAPTAEECVRLAEEQRAGVNAYVSVDVKARNESMCASLQPSARRLRGVRL